MKPNLWCEWKDLCVKRATDFLDRNLQLYDESKELIPILVMLNWNGFLTTNSQPTHGGCHPYQRAYVSGYMPADMRQYLIRHLPRDIVVWQSEADSLHVVARDAQFKASGFTWKGETAVDYETVDPFRPSIVVFHAYDTAWERGNLYLFHQVYDCMDMYRAMKVRRCVLL
jgi:hypothetical protein